MIQYQYKRMSIVALACLPLVISCDAEMSETDIYLASNGPCKGALSELKSNIIWICGTLDDQLVDASIEKLQERDAKIVVDSFGGETFAAIRLAEVVRENGVEIYVNRVCLSACSQILAPSARKLHFLPDSIFAMHDSQSATNAIFGGDITSDLVDQERAEVEFYKAMDVDLGILYDPLLNLFPECIENREEYHQTGALEIIARFDFYMPSEEVFLSYYGGEIGNKYPSLRMSELRYEAATISGMFRVNFGEINHSELAELPDCRNK